MTASTNEFLSFFFFKVALDALISRIFLPLCVLHKKTGHIHGYMNLFTNTVGLGKKHIWRENKIMG